MNKSDRLFHLVVGAVGVMITFVSLGSMASSAIPVGLKQLLSTGHSLSQHVALPTLANVWHVANTTPSSKTTMVNPNGYTNETGQLTNVATDSRVVNGTNAQTSGGNDTNPTNSGSNATSSEQSQNTSVSVKAVGAGVTSESLSNVKSVLSKVNSVTLISEVTGLSLKTPPTIEVVSNAQDYQKALVSLGISSSEATNLVKTTDGFTQNHTVVIPMFQNGTESQLANTVTHELTHVFLNENVGALPSWVNEGIAVYMGMHGQSKVQSAVAFTGYEREMAQDILAVVQKGDLVSLKNNEQSILSGKTPYDYELQDWLAMSDLLASNGRQALQAYLKAVGNGGGSDAFVNAFGVTPSAFEQQFDNVLQKAAQTSDSGVTLSLKMAPTFSGQIAFLQHGQTAWQMFTAKSGDAQVTLHADGTIQSSLEKSPGTSTGKLDNSTLYLTLMPDSTLTYNGQKVTDCGFAFHVDAGLYAFENAWITLANGQTLYPDTTSLFGVSITNVEEGANNNPVVPLIQAESMSP